MSTEPEKPGVHHISYSTSPLKSEPSPVCLEALCSQVLEGTYEVGLRRNLPSLALTGGRLYIEYGTMVITVIGRQEW